MCLYIYTYWSIDRCVYTVQIDLIFSSSALIELFKSTKSLRTVIENFAVVVIVVFLWTNFWQI